MRLSPILAVAERAKTSEKKLERAGRAEEDVHLSDRLGRLIDGLCRPIGLHALGLGRVSVSGGLSLSGGAAGARLVPASPL